MVSGCRYAARECDLGHILGICHVPFDEPMENVTGVTFSDIAGNTPAADDYTRPLIMSLTLEIVGGNRRELGAKVSKTFGQYGGTIGRALDADWALPDAKRYLSSKHASIDFRSGSYYIVDTSRNGVFINDSEEPVGKGKPQRLFSGDTIYIGEYEIRVTIDNVDDTSESLLGTSHIDPVDLKQRVESPDPTGCDLIDAQIITGVGIEMALEEGEEDDLEFDFVFDLDSDTTAVAALGLEAEPTPAAKAPIAQTAAAAAETPTTETLEPSRSDAPQPSVHSGVTSIVERRAVPVGPLDAFFAGAGIEAPKLNPRQAARLMQRLGRLTRELVAGTIDCLHLRAIQKAQLKQGNTVIQPRENNPLKFSANVNEGLARLLLDESDEYMNPVDAVRAVFRDLATHQRAMLTGMRDALDEYLDRLEPETIERGSASGRMGALMSAANKHRYWEIYKEVYSGLVDRPADEFPRAFLDELSKAYEREASKAESAIGTETGLKAG
jgi:type VI secretion system FHA domain protein